MKLIELEGCNILDGGYSKEGKIITDFIVAAEKIIMPDAASLVFRLEIRSGERHTQSG